jgi:hypothetical protein
MFIAITALHFDAARASVVKHDHTTVTLAAALQLRVT